jgi:beta-lactamase regulating signal transducer with metallopeptidase domain
MACLLFIQTLTKKNYMQNLFNKSFYFSLCTFIFLTLTNVSVFAQDSTGKSSTTTTTTTTQTTTIQPWMWIVGGAIVLIIIIALLRGNSSEKTVITKERITD